MSGAVFAEKSAAPAGKGKAAERTAPGNLRIGEPDDAFEREADWMADQVVAGGRAKLDWSLSRMSIDAPLQRKCSCGGSGGGSGECEECKEKDEKKEEKMLRRKAAGPTESDTAPPIVHEVLNSPGKPLDPATRDFFESRFGYDFGKIRVHTDDLSARSASAVNARAYTVGQEVVFGRGQYDPSSSYGRKLLSHELAHVIQQRFVSKPIGSSLRIGMPGDSLEAAADHAAHLIGAGSSKEKATRGMQVASGQVSAPVLQRLSYSEIKEAAYKGLITGIRKATDAYLSLLRKGVTLLPPALRGVGDAIVTIDDVVVGALFAVVLGVIGIIVGFAEGVVDLVKGLVAMIAGVGKLLFDLIIGFFTNFDAAKNDLSAFWEALKGLPAAVGKLVSDWWDRFKKASSERQSLMIGELTGQILALIATWEVAAGRAGTAAKVAAEGTEVGGAAGTVTDVATTGARATRPALTVIEGGGEGGATRATASAVDTEGNAARAIAVQAQEAPRFVPKVVPPPVEVPVTATAAAAKVGTGRAVATAAGVATAKATQISKKKEKEPCGPLPIRWPKLLPLPQFVRDLKRTGKEERESEGIERGAEQARFRDCLNDARNRPDPLDPSQHCKDFGAWFDPNLMPGAPADAHHLHPLYLGGEDAVYNLGALDPNEHQVGHRKLDNQSSMLGTPEWQACEPISPALKNHPPNQEYYIEGEN
jgi:Domain of unknown function (DUF4157)